MSGRKDIAKIRRAYELAGFRVEYGKHMKVLSQSGVLVAVLPCTPSDGRGITNAWREMARITGQRPDKHKARRAPRLVGAIRAREDLTMQQAAIAWPDGAITFVPVEQVTHLRPASVHAYQVAINMGRPKRKGQPYPGGDEARCEDGYFHGPETAIILTYASDMDLLRGDRVLVPVGNHVHAREGLVIARSSAYPGGLKEIYGRAA